MAGNGGNGIPSGRRSVGCPSVVTGCSGRSVYWLYDAVETWPPVRKAAAVGEG